jgi:hypothetical protein
MESEQLYREHFTEDWPKPIPDGWIYAGEDDEFGVLSRFMVPVDGSENLLREAILLLDSISPGDNGWVETLGLRTAVAEMVEIGGDEIVLDDYERDVLDRALDRMEEIGDTE